MGKISASLYPQRGNLPSEVQHGERMTQRHAWVQGRSAVKPVAEKGSSVAEAARSLDIGETLLRSWKQAFENEGHAEARVRRVSGFCFELVWHAGERLETGGTSALVERLVRK